MSSKSGLRWKKSIRGRAMIRRVMALGEYFGRSLLFSAGSLLCILFALVWLVGIV